MVLRPANLLVAVAALALVAGCGSQSYLNENDRLREQVMAMELEIEDLKRRNEELAAELRLASAHPESLPVAVRAATPHVAAISISRLSHFRDTDDDGVPDTLTIYVTPADGRGRFVQLVGELAVNAALLPADADAATIGRLTLDPQALRDAYRAGITGTHYTVDLAVNLPADVNSEAGEVRAQVRAIFTDGRTGQSISAERGVPLTASP